MLIPIKSNFDKNWCVKRVSSAPVWSRQFRPKSIQYSPSINSAQFGTAHFPIQIQFSALWVESFALFLILEGQMTSQSHTGGHDVDHVLGPS